MSFWRPPTYRPLTSQECAERASGQAPSLRRRLTAFIYEGVLLFGIVVPVALIYGIATNQRHAMEGRAGLWVTLVLALLAYFAWCWHHTGQTLAMKTWHLKLVNPEGGSLRWYQVLLRFVTMWLWVVPPLVIAQALHWQGSGRIMGALLAWIAVYALFSLMLPRRQFLHDVISRTRLIDTRPPEVS